MFYPARQVRPLKRLLLLSLSFIYLLSHNSLRAQDGTGRFFHEWGWSLYGDHFAGNVVKTSKIRHSLSSPQPAESPLKTNFIFLGVLGFKYEPRLNIVEFDNNHSISLNMPLTVAGGAGSLDTYATKSQSTQYDVSANVFVKLSTPLFLQFNYKYGATYRTDATKGFTAGAGINAEIPLFAKVGPFPNASDESVNYAKYFLMPAFTIGWRSQGSSGRAKTFNFKLGYSYPEILKENKSGLVNQNLLFSFYVNTIIGY